MSSVDMKRTCGHRFTDLSFADRPLELTCCCYERSGVIGDIWKFLDTSCTRATSSGDRGGRADFVILTALPHLYRPGGDALSESRALPMKELRLCSSRDVMASGILWQDVLQTLTLVDIPRSIAVAQGAPLETWNLHSREPAQHPYTSNEPKSDAGRTALATNSAEQVLHLEYQAILQSALHELRERYHEHWCQPRVFVAQHPRESKKRRLRHENSPAPNEHEVALPERFLADIVHGHHGTIITVNDRDCVTNDTDGITTRALEFHSGQGVFRTIMHTVTIAPQASMIQHAPIASSMPTIKGTNKYRFYIPARSSFSLTSTSETRAFHTYIRNQAQEESAPKFFDCILLDPPWPNRSVKRTHKTAGSTYNIEASIDGVRRMILGTDLDMLMNDDCLVAIWITNKQAIRGLVLDEGGLFESWGIELIEEWLWLKTTMYGETVSPLDALWRKPYEVLLVGRKHKYTLARASGVKLPHKRRVVVAVPDVHSRKPCLKELFEPLLPKDYRALEKDKEQEMMERNLRTASVIKDSRLCSVYVTFSESFELPSFLTVRYLALSQHVHLPVKDKRSDLWTCRGVWRCPQCVCVMRYQLPWWCPSDRQDTRYLMKVLELSLYWCRQLQVWRR
nr:methyltransferase-like protein 4 [Quercus suber]